jgi:hypothetical protein
MWTKVPLLVTPETVLRQPFLWARMHVDDWDTIPEPLRWRALDALLARYSHLLAAPQAWDSMSASDWDVVPQPIRALAFRHMLEYWTGYYGLASRHGLPPRLVSDTLAAIVMQESWFDHRAVNVNPFGNRDLGVGQASDRARARIRALHERGAVDVAFDDDEYFDPWKGTRFVALWVGLLLDECDSDLETSVRAYHRGTKRAIAGDGEEYLALVGKRFRRIVRTPGRPDAWTYLVARDGELTRDVRPWLVRPSATALDSTAADQLASASR